jgi:hypothetical protein
MIEFFVVFVAHSSGLTAVEMLPGTNKIIDFSYL